MIYFLSAVSSDIINILGYYAPELAVYGLASDKVTYMMSNDTGSTWVTVSSAKYNATMAATGDWTAAIPVPWIYSAGFDTSTPIAQYTQGIYGGFYYYSDFISTHFTSAHFNNFALLVLITLVLILLFLLY